MMQVLKAIAVLAAFVCVIAPRPVRSQEEQSYAQQYAASLLMPISLQSADMRQSGPNEITINLLVTGDLPQATILQNDASQVRITLNFVNGAAVTLPAPGSSSFLSTVNLEPGAGQTTLVATGAAKIHATVRISGRIISIVLTSNASESHARGRDDQVGLPAHVQDHDGDVIEVVHLNYADVSEIVGLLTENSTMKRNDYFTPQEPSFGSPNSTVQSSLSNPSGQGPGGPSDDSYGERADQIVGVDRRLNAIVLQGPPEVVAQLKAKIALLDMPVQSVTLETIFVELDENGAKNLGIDLNSGAGNLAMITYSKAIGTDTTTYTNVGGIVSMQAAVQAEVRKGHGKIISKPRISAQNGATAKIVTGDAIPILTSIALSGVNAVSQQVQYVNVGVTLQIAPRISSDGFVSSHIFCAVSSVTGSVQGYPTISQREAVTSATVKDGEAFIIGGLMQESEITSRTNIPGISKMPLLGWIGRQVVGSSSKTDLYIIVVPHIVRGPAVVPAYVDEALNSTK